MRGKTAETSTGDVDVSAASIMGSENMPEKKCLLTNPAQCLNQVIFRQPNKEKRKTNTLHA